MNEVEKMYENAGVEPDYDYFTFFDDKVHKIGRTMHLCKEELKHWLENYQKDYVAIKVIRVDKAYPPFTAEKQISIIKWLLESYDIGFSQLGQRIDTSLDGTNCISGLGSGDTFEESLAQAINDLWQDLTEVEKAEIKNILEM